MPPAAKADVTRAALTWFALFNLIAVPLLGRGVWLVIAALNTDQLRPVAVSVAPVTAAAILAVNVWLTRRATRSGLPRAGQMALWLVTGGTFAITVAAGIFSPINLLIALVRAAGA